MPGVRLALGWPSRAYLVDGGEADREAAPRGAQIQPPDTRALSPGEPLRLIEVPVEPPGPVVQGDGVVLPEALNVLGVKAGALERQLHAGEWQRLAVREHVAR